MDQAKIGKFIAECRKKQGITQIQLAEQLGITDRAVSKWETGRSLPDSAIMLDLCRILEITVNDLLSGEVVIMENYNKEMENKLLEMVRQKESADKRMLAMEIFIGVIFSVVMFVLIMVASFVQMADWIRILLILLGFIPFVVSVPFLVKIEQTAGYYECQKCGHRYVPTFSSVLWAMHVNRTRYMKCPKCQEKSWQKKVISKDKPQ